MICIFFFKQKTAYEMRISDWSSDVCSSDLEFRQKCREYANAQIDIQRKDFKRLGVIGDWEHPYRSLDFRFEADEMRALAKVIDNGHLVRGVKPVYWCFDCGSALAEAANEYQDKVSPEVDAAYAARDAKAMGRL